MVPGEKKTLLGGRVVGLAGNKANSAPLQLSLGSAWQLANLRGLMLRENEKKLYNGPPFASFLREKLKITHLLPERSAHRDDHFL